MTVSDQNKGYSYRQNTIKSMLLVAFFVLCYKHPNTNLHVFSSRCSIWSWLKISGKKQQPLVPPQNTFQKVSRLGHFSLWLGNALTLQHRRCRRWNLNNTRSLTYCNSWTWLKLILTRRKGLHNRAKPIFLLCSIGWSSWFARALHCWKVLLISAKLPFNSKSVGITSVASSVEDLR